MKLKITRPNGEVERAELSDTKSNEWTKYYKITIGGKTYYAILGKKKDTHMYVQYPNGDKYYVQKKYLNFNKLVHWRENFIKNKAEYKLTKEEQSYLNNSVPLDMSYFYYYSDEPMDGFFHDHHKDTDNIMYLDLSKMNVSYCKSLYYAFCNTSLYAVNFLNWNTSNIENLKGAFYNSWGNYDLSSWNTENCTNFDEMFYYTHINFLDISNFNTDKVTNISNIFKISEIENTGYIIIPEYSDKIKNFALAKALQELNANKKYLLCTSKSIEKYKTTEHWSSLYDKMDDINNYNVVRDRGTLIIFPNNQNKLVLHNGNSIMYALDENIRWVFIVPKGVKYIKLKNDIKDYAKTDSKYRERKEIYYKVRDHQKIYFGNNTNGIQTINGKPIANGAWGSKTFEDFLEGNYGNLVIYYGEDIQQEGEKALNAIDISNESVDNIIVLKQTTHSEKDSVLVDSAKIINFDIINDLNAGGGKT